jgi:GNAT superfamily N-acetyltransferase
MGQTAVGVQVRPSSIDELLSKASSLIADHGKEVLGELPHPDDLRLKAIEARKGLHCWAAWDGTQIVGYSVFLIGWSLNEMGRVEATSMALYVSPETRGHRVAADLMAATNAHARDLGAAYVDWHAKWGSEMQYLLARKANPHHIVFRIPV